MLLQNGNCWTNCCCNAAQQQQPNAEAARSKNQKHFFYFFCLLPVSPSNKNHMYVRFLYVCMCVCVRERVSARVCVGRSFLHLLVGCFLCRCRRAALGFVLHGSRALSLALLLLRPRPLLLPLLPSYSCVAFFLTFAEFIDIFSICFCALLSLSERALSLFLPLSLSFFLPLSLILSLCLSHTHTSTCFFCCFL